jgi:Domain of unknown function (DUF6089)
MNSVYKVSPFFLLFFFFYNSGVFAQFVPSRYEVGINVGTLIYQGDLAKGDLGYTRSLKPAVSLWASRSFDDYFSLRANVLRGAIGADESTYSSPAWRRHRNLAFSSSVTEFSALLVWDMFGKTYREGMHRFSPYLFIGAGLTVLNVKRDWSRFDTVYFPSKTAAYIGLSEDTLHKVPSILPVIPAGAGFRYMISNHFYLNAEATYRISQSDYIDGFKYSGNPKKNDHYYGVSIGVSYRFGRDLTSCPKVVL